jgi:hypothetical protein
MMNYRKLTSWRKTCPYGIETNKTTRNQLLDCERWVNRLLRKMVAGKYGRSEHAIKRVISWAITSDRIEFALRKKPSRTSSKKLSLGKESYEVQAKHPKKFPLGF